MKQIFIFLLIACLFISCDERPRSRPNFSDVSNKGCVLREFTVRGKTHEYLMYESGYQAGMEHLPECKYCQKDSIYE